MSPPFLSVLVPAYNEEHRLRSTLEQLFEYLASRSFSVEVLVVDDGSEDQTAEIAEAYAASEGKSFPLRVFRNHRNHGKGYSVRRGMLESRGTYALLTDADLSAPIQEMAKLEREVIGGPYHIAIGSRDIEGSKVEVRQSRLRETGGKIFNRAVRLATGLPYRDTQCGFKLFEMSHCKDIFRKQRAQGFAFDVEVLYIAKKWGLRIKEVPVLWRHAPDSKLDFFPDASKMALDLFRIRWNAAAGRYEPERE